MMKRNSKLTGSFSVQEVEDAYLEAKYTLEWDKIGARMDEDWELFKFTSNKMIRVEALWSKFCGMANTFTRTDGVRAGFIDAFGRVLKGEI